jgi:hypothetical protein
VNLFPPTTGFALYCAPAQLLFSQKHWHKSSTRLMPKLAFRTVDVSDANSERPSNSVEMCNEVPWKNYDLCYGLMIMKRYEDHSFEVKSLEQN